MSRTFVGNDVVDLTNPRTEGRAIDERFVGRIFDADEQAQIQSAGESDLELWCRWAAKEAGFKAISKVLGAPPRFVHRAFKVAWTAQHDVDPSAARAGEVLIREGTVEHLGHRASVSVEFLPGAIHAVACWSDAEPVRVGARVALADAPGSRWRGSLEELIGRFSEREADAIRSRESAAVRLGAREDLARLLGVPEDRLEIVCAPGPTTQRPPRALVDGHETSTDLSLSHDGRWIAWAIWIGSRPA